jgi:hypothetical protein
MGDLVVVQSQMEEVETRLDEAERLLAQVRNIAPAEVADIHDAIRVIGFLEAVRVATQKANLSRELLNEVVEVKAWYERRIGNILSLVRREQGKRREEPTELQQALDEADLGHSIAHTYQMLAAVPEEEFREEIERLKEADELSTTALIRFAKKHRQKKRPARPVVQLEDVILTRYPVIVASPAWPDPDLDGKSTMTVEQIAKAGIEERIDPDGCHVYLTAPSRFVPAGLRFFDLWDVDYIAMLVIDLGKSAPYGDVFRNDAEYVLVGGVGSLPFTLLGASSVLRGAAGLYALVRKISPEPRLDMFPSPSLKGKQRPGFEMAT